MSHQITKETLPQMLSLEDGLKELIQDWKDIINMNDGLGELNASETHIIKNVVGYFEVLLDDHRKPSDVDD